MLNEKEIIKDNSIIAAFALTWGREGFVKSGCPIQIAYTDDGGFNYVLTDIGNPDEKVLCWQSVFVLNDKNIFIGTSNGRIFRSQDKADSWQLIEDGNISNTGCTLIQAINGKILAAFQNGTIAYSLDKGDTWDTCQWIEWKPQEEWTDK